MPSTSFITPCIAACMVLLTACQTPPPGSSAVKYLDVNGAKLPFVEQGSGPTVVLVHGAVSDYRTWDRHRQALAEQGYRVVSYAQRYFGT
jgi:alpha-beta hydrolase superfamily lysophospholipase